MREPSIHIKLPTFQKLNQDLGLGLSDPQIMELFKKARSLSDIQRSAVNLNKKVANKVQRGTTTVVGDAQLLADVIYSTRISLKHLGVTKIKQSDPQWSSLKELAPIINEFCDVNSLDRRKGYIDFVKVGLELAKNTKRSNMNYFGSWALQKSGWIIDTWTSFREIQLDKFPDGTEQLARYYKDKVLGITGIPPVIRKEDATTYINFIKAREQADEIGLDYETYIDAQFEALEFCNGIPQISDLANKKAYERTIKYLGKHKITVVKDLSDDDGPDDSELWKAFKH